jgi:hypothetical protein
VVERFAWRLWMGAVCLVAQTADGIRPICV